MELHVYLEADDGERGYALYDDFLISSIADNYRLHVSGFSGSLPESLSYHNGQQFSTYDNDNDLSEINCAAFNKGAWWYGSCQYVNLNGRYSLALKNSGIRWRDFNENYSAKIAIMKLRPRQ